MAHERMKKRDPVKNQLELDEIPSLLDCLSLSEVPTTEALGSLLSPIDDGNALERRNLRSLPSLDLGIKASATTRQWREMERINHRKMVKNMKSPLMAEVKAHVYSLDRNAAILSFGEANKAKALESQLHKIKLENHLLAKRLCKVEQTDTEITWTNMPSKRRHVKAAAERVKYLQTARRSAQTQLDYENSLILKRLHNARPTVPQRENCVLDFNRHRRIRRNMCKLVVPPEQYERHFAERACTPAVGSVSSFGKPVAKKGQSKLKPLPKKKRPQSSLLIVSESEPWLSVPSGATSMFEGCEEELDEQHIQQPNSRSRNQKLYNVSDVRSTHSSIRSSDDRGQVFHEWVSIRSVRPGEQPEEIRSLLIGFKKPNEDGKLIFEVTFGKTTRYAQVTYEQLKAAIAKASESEGSMSLAQVSASRLTLFGEAEQAVLVWNEL